MVLKKWIQAITILATLWLAKAQKKLPADFLVEGLQEIEPAFAQFEGNMYSGLLPMDNGNRNGELMFWLFAPHEPSTDKTLMVWLNGGPGCSAFFAGVFFEHGPVTIPSNPAGYCCVGQDELLVYNPHNWASATHMLYVEQPVGVGFSHGGPEPVDEKDLSGDFYSFLLNFYSVFEDYRDYQLFLFGESYAGMYVPSIAHRIHRENSKKSTVTIPLTGVGIGNGLLDARVQGPIRIDYAFYHGMIDTFTRDMLKELWHRCISHRSMKDPLHSFNIPDDCGMLSAIPLAAGKNAIPEFPSGPNIYDVTTWDPYAILTGDNSISRFYNNPAVKEKMHAPADTFWRGCIPGAGRRRLQQESRNLMASLLIHDKPLSTVPYIGELLNGGIRVIMYNGDRDMACNAAGTELLLNDMEWGGADKWYGTARGLWTVNDEPAGYAKTHKNLSFVVIYNSGHLAPFNRPANSLDLIQRFLTNTSYYDYDLPNFGDYVKKKHKKSHDALELAEAWPSQGFSLLNVEPSILPVMLAFVMGFGVAYLSLQGRNNGYQRL